MGTDTLTGPQGRWSDPWRLWMAAAVTGATVVYAWFLAASSFVIDGTRYWTLFDDAMISMRYGRNLAEGYGLIWNPDGEAVEGYTNLAWTLWMALLHAVGLPENLVPLAVSLTSVVLLGVTARMAWLLSLRLFDDRAAAVAAATLVLAYYPLVFWSLRGMEVGLIAALLLGACLLVVRIVDRPSRRRIAGLCAVLAVGVLTRTDFAVGGMVVAGWLIWRTTGRSRFAPAAAVLGALAGHTLFRLAYYGDVLPNTYYLKMTGVPLVDRIGRGLGAAVSIAPQLLVPLMAAGVAWMVTRRRPVWALLAAVWAAQVAYSVWVGGDAWEWFSFTNRYLTVGMPALFALGSGLVAFLRQQAWARGWVALCGVVALLFVASSGVATARWLPEVGPHVAEDAEQARMGVAIREATSDDVTIALSRAGTIPYFSRRTTVDLLGKSDPVIAHAPVREGTSKPGHQKWDFGWSVGHLRPDILVGGVSYPGPSICDDLTAWGYRPVGRSFVRGVVGSQVNDVLAADTNMCSSGQPSP